MVWSLAPALQMLDQTVPNVALDLTVGTRGIPKGEVVHPALQMPIQLSNQDRNRLMTLMTVCHFAQLLPLALNRLIRRDHIQIFPITSFQIAVVPKRVSQKVQTCPFFPQVHHPRLFPIDLQLEFAFQPRLDKLDGFRSHLFRQRHKVSSPGESHSEALLEPCLNLSAHTAPATEPCRAPICQCAHNFGSRREIRAIQCVALRKCLRSFLYFLSAQRAKERSSCRIGG